MKKTLIIAPTLPPMITSVAIVMGKLLKYFPRESFCILMGNPEKDETPVDFSSRLICKYYYCNVPGFRRKKDNRFLRLIEFFYIFLILFKGLRIIHKEKIGNILIAPNRGNFFIASYFMYKLTGKPLFIYMFDLYEEGKISRIRRFMAKIFEERIFRAALNIFVMSESMQSHYRKKYNLDTELIPHPVILHSNNQTPTKFAKNENSSIVFTGMVTDAQRDSIKNMVDVINTMENIKLFIYTPSSKDGLILSGISGKNVIHNFASPDRILSVQKTADILFLPMGFNSPYPDIVKTASPGKLPEYLAAGRPILIHAPEYAYISSYARKCGFALVVNKPDLELLKGAILRILRDESLRQKLVKNALITARKHDAKELSKKLQHILGGISESFGPAKNQLFLI